MHVLQLAADEQNLQGETHGEHKLRPKEFDKY